MRWGGMGEERRRSPPFRTKPYRSTGTNERSHAICSASPGYAMCALGILSVVVFSRAGATGAPLYLILPMSASKEDFDNARRYLGLDRPYVEQYLSFVGRAVTGDFGTSLRARRPVGELIRECLPNSLKLAAFAMVVSLAMAFPLGIMAAVRKGTGIDRAAQI